MSTTLAAIKIAALQIMFADYASLSPANILDYYADTNLAQYLNAMNPVIDRCIDRIKAERLQPTTILVLADGTVGTYRTVYDLAEITDFYAVHRVIFEDDAGNYENYEYIIEGASLKLKNTTRTGEFRLEYYTEIATAATITDTGNMPVSDELCHLIPYFIKGDLYQEEEPNLASEARNIFEQSLAAIKARPIVRNKQYKTKMVYKP